MGHAGTDDGGDRGGRADRRGGAGVRLGSLGPDDGGEGARRGAAEARHRRGAGLDPRRTGQSLQRQLRRSAAPARRGEGTADARTRPAQHGGQERTGRRADDGPRPRQGGAAPRRQAGSECEQPGGRGAEGAAGYFKIVAFASTLTLRSVTGSADSEISIDLPSSRITVSCSLIVGVVPFSVSASPATGRYSIVMSTRLLFDCVAPPVPGTGITRGNESTFSTTGRIPSLVATSPPVRMRTMDRSATVLVTGFTIGGPPARVSVMVIS